MNFKPYGIIPPIITPFNCDGQVDYKMLGKMVDFLISNGVHGIFPLGTTGEFYAVDDDEYKNILLTVKETVDGRVPVYAGANHITTRGVIKLLKICEEVAVDAVSILTPMFISQTQDELYNYFKDIAYSTNLPIVLYNNPPKTGINIAPSTLVRLSEIDNIVAIKDSSGDMTNSLEYIRLTKDNDSFSVIMGRDTLIYPALKCGAVASIASCANIAPRLVSDIYDKFMAGDDEGALASQFKLSPLRLATNMGTFPAVIKEGLVMQGIDVGKCMDPIAELTPDEKDKLKKVLQDMELIQ